MHGDMPAEDTQPTGVTTVARTCGMRFTRVGTVGQELADLFDLAILEQNDSLADAVLAQRLTKTETRDSITGVAMQQYLHEDKEGIDDKYAVLAVALVGCCEATGCASRCSW